MTLWEVRRKLSSEAEAGTSMATSRFKTDTPSVQSDTRPGFGRGSAVREYWLERCQGFSAVRSDGRALGRVKRVENRIDGTFLRLAGVRARTIPLASVETVWPGASLLLISDGEVDESSSLAWRCAARRPVRGRLGKTRRFPGGNSSLKLRIQVVPRTSPWWEPRFPRQSPRLVPLSNEQPVLSPPS
jgi:hypothetical protein